MTARSRSTRGIATRWHVPIRYTGLEPDSKGPARTAERGGVRSGISSRGGQVLGTKPVGSPRACGVSETDPCNKNRRLDEKSEHAIRPIANPAILSFSVVTT